MVRAGVVSHPAMWPFCGYNEIQEPRRKNALIDYEMLQRLVGAKFYDQLRSSNKGWVEEYPGDEAKERQDEWTAGIAVGSRSFIENVKSLLGLRAKGREVRQGGGSRYQLREDAAQYKALFRVEKDNIDPENTCVWNFKTE
jgi:putative transposase